MMLLTALLLAAQPATKNRPPVRARRPAASVTAPPSADWLMGLWVADSAKGEQMEGCAEWTALFFQADGHYLHGQATGQWSVEGPRLVQKEITFTQEGGGDEEESVGDPVTSRILRLSNDRMRLVDDTGRGTLYLRCPKPETPLAR